MYKGMRILLAVAVCLMVFSAVALADESLVARHHSHNYVPGQKLAINNAISFSGALSAIGVRVILPEGWYFIDVYSAYPPEVKPMSGAIGAIEFAWIVPPLSPLNFIYEIGVPQGQFGDKEINSTVLYRRLGGEIVEAVQPNPLLINTK